MELDESVKRNLQDGYCLIQYICKQCGTLVTYYINEPNYTLSHNFLCNSCKNPQKTQILRFSPQSFKRSPF